jgi:hypothetical protein
LPIIIIIIIVVVAIASIVLAWWRYKKTRQAKAVADAAKTRKMLNGPGTDKDASNSTAAGAGAQHTMDGQRKRKGLAAAAATGTRTDAATAQRHIALGFNPLLHREVLGEDAADAAAATTNVFSRNKSSVAVASAAPARRRPSGTKASEIQALQNETQKMASLLKQTSMYRRSASSSSSGNMKGSFFGRKSLRLSGGGAGAAPVVGSFSSTGTLADGKAVASFTTLTASQGSQSVRYLPGALSRVSSHSNAVRQGPTTVVLSHVPYEEEQKSLEPEAFRSIMNPLRMPASFSKPVQRPAPQASSGTAGMTPSESTDAGVLPPLDGPQAALAAASAAPATLPVARQADYDDEDTARFAPAIARPKMTNATPRAQARQAKLAAAAAAAFGPTAVADVEGEVKQGAVSITNTLSTGELPSTGAAKNASRASVQQLDDVMMLLRRQASQKLKSASKSSLGKGGLSSVSLPAAPETQTPTSIAADAVPHPPPPRVTRNPMRRLLRRLSSGRKTMQAASEE